MNMAKDVLIDIRKVVRIGYMPAVTLPKDWFEANKGKMGDRVLIKVEMLKGKDVKTVDK